jgi:5-methylcytosine-specific restriction endonuclease McrA
MHDILVLDVAGTPVRWVDHESAASYYASGKVRWELGADRTVLHGGISRQHGCRSTLEIAAIIAIDGPRWRFRGAEDRVALTRSMVFARDRHICAYCGGRFSQAALEMEHVTPSSRGGFTVWQNVVSACRACNQRKGNRSPEAAGMPLLYVPYVPNRHEAFILANRRILADQMAFLLAGVPRHSRLWAADATEALEAPAAATPRPQPAVAGSGARKRPPNAAAGRGRENR